MNKCSAASTFSPPHYGKVVGVELYDHDGDNANSFGDFENVNLALRADHKDVVAQLHAELTRSTHLDRVELHAYLDRVARPRGKLWFAKVLRRGDICSRNEFANFTGTKFSISVYQIFHYLVL